MSAFSASTVATADTPAVGDTLKATFGPTGAADAKATYQWYRGTAKLISATSSSYTVTSDDQNSTLKVEVTLANGTVLTSEVTKAVAAPTIANYKVGIFDATTYSSSIKAVTAPKVGTAVYAILYNDKNANGALDSGEQVTTSTQSYAWYIDGTTTAAKAGTATQGYTAVDGDLGHTLTCVISGSGSLSGKATSAATSAVTKAITGKTMNVVSDAGDKAATTHYYTGLYALNVAGGVTTLTASIGTASNPVVSTTNYQDFAADTTTTVSYQWYTVKNGVTTAIAGATSSKYEPTAAEAIGDVTYKVVATGTGSYTGTVEGTVAPTWKNASAVAVSAIEIDNADGDSVTGVIPGEVLNAVSTPLKAGSKLTYTWTLKNSSTVVETKTGSSYTVPSTAAATYTVTLSAVSTDEAAYTISSSVTDTATVKTGVTGATLSIASAQIGTAKTGTTASTLEVGDYLFATATPAAAVTASNVTYKWYEASDATKTAVGGDHPYLAIDSTMIGKSYVCTVSGNTDYAGTATSSASSIVTAPAKITVAGSPATVGQALTVKVGSSANSDAYADYATYSWKVAGVEVSKTNTYTPVAADAGKSITLTVSGKVAGSLTEATAGDLTWNNTNVGVVTGSLAVKVGSVADKTYATATDTAVVAVGSTAYAYANGGSGTYTYAWVDLESGTTVSTSSSAPMYGKYTKGLKLTVTDSNGNTATKTITLS